MSPPSQAHPSPSKPSSVSIRFSKDWEDYLKGPELFLQNHSLKQMLYVAYLVGETPVGKAQVKNKEASHPKEIIVTSLIEGSGDWPISVWVAHGGVSGANGAATRTPTSIQIANDLTDFSNKVRDFWERAALPTQEHIIPDLRNSIRVETSSEEVITFKELAKKSGLEIN